MENPLPGMVANWRISPILVSVKTKRFRVSSIGIIFGALLFVFVGVIAALGDIQSVTFDNQKLAPERLKTLQCPVVITPNETGIISATITNQTNRAMMNRMRAVITNANDPELERIEYEFTLNPEEIRELTWPITSENAQANRFILARVHQVATYATPLRNASCGVMVIDVPYLTGFQLILSLMGLAALLSGVSLIVWGIHCSPKGWRNPGFRRWLFFTVTALLISLFALAGYWGIAVIITILWVMQIIDLIQFFSSPSTPSGELKAEN